MDKLCVPSAVEGVVSDVDPDKLSSVVTFGGSIVAVEETPAVSLETLLIE